MRVLRREEATHKDTRSLPILPGAEEDLPIEGGALTNPTGVIRTNRIRGPAPRQQKQLHREEKRG